MYKFILLLLIHYGCGLTRVDPLVDTRNGLIRGVKSDNGLYSMFLGIPYATVDHDDPFGPSVPQQSFEDIFEATDDSAVCPQMSQRTHLPIGTLDCLNLNVYVPNVASSQNRLPVMVWIHGGAFTGGSGNKEQFQPNFLIKHDIILVTMNYRLQAFGFMCLGTKEVPGNQGLKDQLLALRWIKENIGYFGGDVNKITVFGESAGAMSTHLHILSPFERLFDRAIIQSGVWGSPWAIVEPDSGIPIRISKQLGFETDSVTEALSFLTKVDPLLVVSAADEINTSTTGQPYTKPCVEKKFDGVENFVTDYPFNAKSAKARTTPIMIGYTSNEMLFEVSGKEDEYFNDAFLTEILKFGFKTDNFTDMVDNVRHYYLGDETTGDDFRRNLVYFQSDFIFNHPTERSIRQYIQDGASRIYHYRFSYNGERSSIRRNNITEEAAHGDDLGYLFSSENEPEDFGTEEDLLTVDRMTTLWTNFAKYSEPIPQTTDLLPVSWPTFTTDSQNYLDIDSELTLKKRPFHDRMVFWDLFYRIFGDKQIGVEN